MAHVRQTIPLAPFLRVEIIHHIVIGKRAQWNHLVGHRCATEERRFGETNFGVQPEDLAILHQACSVDYALRSQEVQATELIIIAKHAERHAKQIEEIRNTLASQAESAAGQS